MGRIAIGITLLSVPVSLLMAIIMLRYGRIVYALLALSIPLIAYAISYSLLSLAYFIGRETVLFYSHWRGWREWFVKPLLGLT